MTSILSTNLSKQLAVKNTSQFHSIVEIVTSNFKIQMNLNKDYWFRVHESILYILQALMTINLTFFL